MRTFREAFAAAGERPPNEKDNRSAKKNYAEKLSRNLATLFAGALRKSFPKIMPGDDGKQQESLARTAKGFKKLDVNYSVPELGLGLGVSIKTINFRDGENGRYTKNYTRNDNELRAEALDYHERQPWAVLIAVIFLPVDSCEDYKGGQKKGDESSSSFGQAIKIFRSRANRNLPTDSGELFERVFIGLYETRDDGEWDVRFFDVMDAPPRSGRPKNTLSFEEVIGEITRTYDSRNNPPFLWAPEE